MNQNPDRLARALFTGYNSNDVPNLKCPRSDSPAQEAIVVHIGPMDGHCGDGTPSCDREGSRKSVAVKLRNAVVTLAKFVGPGFMASSLSARR